MEGVSIFSKFEKNSTMKKHLLFASLFLSTAAMAQFTQSNEPVNPSSTLMYVLDSIAPNYAGTVGTGVTWDYSNVAGVSGQTKTVEVLDPSATAQGANFTTSTKALQIPSFLTSYFTSSSSSRNSQGFSFVEPTFGVVNANLTDDELLMNYPFALGNVINDVVSGTVTASLGTFPCAGVSSATVDGIGTLKLNSTTTLNNVTRYRLADSLNADAGFPIGVVTLKRIQYEYYDFTTSNLPVFIHTSLSITIGGSPQALSLVMSSVAPDNFLSVASEELENVTIYPNPATTNITLAGLPSNGTIQLIDNQGKTIQTIASTAGTQSIDLVNVTPGAYILSIVTENGTATQHIVVE
jgi:hypothetical protein